jgi:hypothetical protein
MHGSEEMSYLSFLFHPTMAHVWAFQRWNTVAFDHILKASGHSTDGCEDCVSEGYSMLDGWRNEERGLQRTNFKSLTLSFLLSWMWINACMPRKCMCMQWILTWQEVIYVFWQYLNARNKFQTLISSNGSLVSLPVTSRIQTEELRVGECVWQDLVYIQKDEFKTLIISILLLGE